MKEKEVITRKMHTCEACGIVIPVGSKAKFYTLRGPVFEPTSGDVPGVGWMEGPDKQVGIYYHRGYTCADTKACNDRIQEELE